MTTKSKETLYLLAARDTRCVCWRGHTMRAYEGGWSHKRYSDSRDDCRVLTRYFPVKDIVGARSGAGFVFLPFEVDDDDE